VGGKTETQALATIVRGMHKEENSGIGNSGKKGKENGIECFPTFSTGSNQGGSWRKLKNMFPLLLRKEVVFVEVHTLGQGKKG